MELLQELLALQKDVCLSETFALLEELGNLKSIDKNLTKGLMKNTTWANKTRQLRDTLGRDSKIEIFTDKDQNRAFNRLKDDKDVVAIVLQYGDDQVLMITSNSKSDQTRDETYTLVASTKYFDSIDEERFNKEFSKLKYNKHNGSSYAEHDWDFRKDRMIDGTGSSVMGKIKKAMMLVYDASKNTDTPVKTIVIQRDKERLAKGNERARSRYGMIPLPTGNKVSIGGGKYISYDRLAADFFKNLKSDLRRRLETYKASKAKSFASPGEMLASLIEEGYFEKLKFMGFTYSLRDDRISLGALTGKDPFGSGAYVEYRIQETSTEFKELEKKIADWRNSLDLPEDSKEEREAVMNKYYEERDKMLPPRDFKVKLKLEGGLITPVEVVIGKDRAWVY